MVDFFDSDDCICSSGKRKERDEEPHSLIFSRRSRPRVPLLPVPVGPNFDSKSCDEHHPNDESKEYCFVSGQGKKDIVVDGASSVPGSGSLEFDSECPGDSTRKRKQTMLQEGCSSHPRLRHLLVPRGENWLHPENTPQAHIGMRCVPDKLGSDESSHRNKIPAFDDDRESARDHAVHVPASCSQENISEEHAGLAGNDCSHNENNLYLEINFLLCQMHLESKHRRTVERGS